MRWTGAESSTQTFFISVIPRIGVPHAGGDCSMPHVEWRTTSYSFRRRSRRRGRLIRLGDRGVSSSNCEAERWSLQLSLRSTVNSESTEHKVRRSQTLRGCFPQSGIYRFGTLWCWSGRALMLLRLRSNGGRRMFTATRASEFWTRAGWLRLWWILRRSFARQPRGTVRDESSTIRLLAPGG